MIYEEVDLAFGGLERIDALLRDIATFNAGLLKIVAPPSLSEGVLSTIPTRFLDRFPKVRVSIDSRSTETARNMVANRTADCGFMKLPQLLRAEPLVLLGFGTWPRRQIDAPSASATFSPT